MIEVTITDQEYAEAVNPERMIAERLRAAAIPMVIPFLGEPYPERGVLRCSRDQDPMKRFTTYRWTEVGEKVTP